MIHRYISYVISHLLYMIILKDRIYHILNISQVSRKMYIIKRFTNQWTLILPFNESSYSASNLLVDVLIIGHCILASCAPIPVLQVWFQVNFSHMSVIESFFVIFNAIRNEDEDALRVWRVYVLLLSCLILWY